VYTDNLLKTVHVQVFVRTPNRQNQIGVDKERIRSCGGQSGLFTKQALTLIHQASQGVFRTIGTIATNALLKVQILGGSQVEAEHVQAILQR